MKGLPLEEKVDILLKWIVDNEREPRRAAEDKHEKALASLMANLRTSKRNDAQGMRGKPLNWSDLYDNMARSYNVRTEGDPCTYDIREDIFDRSATFMQQNHKRLYQMLDHIAEHGELGKAPYTSWLSTVRNARTESIEKGTIVPPWHESLKKLLIQYKLDKCVDIREDIFEVPYSDHKTIESIKKLIAFVVRHEGRTPRSHILRITNKGKDLTPMELELLSEEQSMGDQLNALKRAKHLLDTGKSKDCVARRFYPVYQQMAEDAGYPDLFAMGKKG